MLLTNYIFFAIAFSSYTTVLSAEWIGCGVLETFSVKLESHKKIYVHDAEISFKYDRDELAVYEYPNTDAVNILINNTLILFEGHAVEEDKEFDPKTFKTSRILSTQIAGSARLITDAYSNDNSLTDCNVYLSPNRKDDLEDLPKRIQIEILDRAATCIRASICTKLGKITHDDIQNARIHPYAFGPLSIMHNKASDRNLDYKSEDTTYDSQSKIIQNNMDTSGSSSGQLESNNINIVELKSAVNMLVDFAISEFVRKIKTESQGYINLPDISEKFSESSNWTPHGEFSAINGTFSGLTTLLRTKDAVVSHKGLEFIASCGFGLTKANLHYEKYKLKYGIKVSGMLTTEIDGVELALGIAVDYNKSPCQAILQDLQIVKLGKMKINLTGLGPLNKIISKLITWLTKKLSEQIIAEVEENIKSVVAQHMHNFNCEKFRP